MTPQEANQKLFQAAEAGNLGDAQAALAAGADPNARDKWQWTPLHYAPWKGHTDFARLLIEKGADPNVRNEVQQTPLHFAARYGRTDLARLLIEKGAEPNAMDDWQQTPLHYAAEGGHADLVEILNAAAKSIRPASPPPTREQIKADRWQREIEEVRRKVKAGITDPNEVGF